MPLMSPMTPEEQARLMSASASPAFAQVQHPMHAMVAPIGPAPPELDPMAIQGMTPDYENEQAKNAGMSATSPKAPKVTTMSSNERYQEKQGERLMSDMQKDANPYGSANNHPGIGGKLLHGLNVARNIGEEMLVPNVARIDPSSSLHRKIEEAGISKGLNENENEIAKREAQQAATEQAGARTHQIEQQTAAGVPVEISPEQADELEAPELAGTKIAPAVLAQLYKQRGINQQRLEANQNTVQGRRDVANIQTISREQLAQLKPEQRDDKAIRLNQQLSEGQPLSPSDQSYLKAYQKYINDTKVIPGVIRMQTLGAFRPVKVLGDDGNVEYQYSGQAIKSGASTPDSMNFRTAVGMSKFMTSGKGGQTITAYNTANDHLELLGKAMDALQNGDVQAINQLNNTFKQQFGSAAPTNVNAVKAMLAGELANVAKVTGATDQEIQEQKENINRAASPEQIRGFIETNHDLMDQKAYELYQQYQMGLQGQPAFDTGLSGHRPASGAGAGTMFARDPQGKLHEAPAGTPLPQGWTKEEKK